MHCPSREELQRTHRVLRELETILLSHTVHGPNEARALVEAFEFVSALQANVEADLAAVEAGA